jgi:hypothetical protein
MQKICLKNCLLAGILRNLRSALRKRKITQISLSTDKNWSGIFRKHEKLKGQTEIDGELESSDWTTHWRPAPGHTLYLLYEVNPGHSTAHGQYYMQRDRRYKEVFFYFCKHQGVVEVLSLSELPSPIIADLRREILA